MAIKLNLSMRKRARTELETQLIDVYTQLLGADTGVNIEQVIDNLVQTIEYELSGLGINSFDDFVDSWEYENGSIEKHISDTVAYSPVYSDKREAGLVLLQNMYKKLREQNYKEYYTLVDLTEELDSIDSIENLRPILDRILSEMSQLEAFDFLDIPSIKAEAEDALE